MADSIREKFAALATEAARQWHGWARDIAAGRPSPQPRAILDAASVLRISDPAGQLEADAAVIADVARLEREAADVADDLAAKLKPWGGKLDRLDAAITEATSKLTELKTFRSTWSWSIPDDLASEARQLRAKNRHLFPVEGR
jgi:hypothetical protein